jgi:hypothetical protein
MRTKSLQSLLFVSAFFAAFLSSPQLAHAQWTQLSSPPNASTCLSLTDGTVMCQTGEQNKSWQRLTPDQFGIYASGSWSAMQDLPQPSPTGYAPLYYASAVMSDGRVFVIGGEYNNGYTTCGASPPAKNCPTTLGYIMDPTTNSGKGTWSGPITVPAGYSGSDNQSIILEDGTILIADIGSGNIYQLNPSALTLSLVNATGKLDGNDEEGWVLLPNGKILIVDANNTATFAFELYDPTTLSWSSPGATPVNLADITSTGAGSREVGPSVLRPGGSVIHFGGNPSGQNATYDSVAGTWATATSFPVVGGKQLTVADGPASILPNGSVLVEAAPGVSGGKFGTGARFYEYTSGGALNDVSSGGPSVGSEASFHGRMLVLPSGEVLWTHGDGNIFLYNNGSPPQDAWRPFIISAPTVLGLGDTYTITGNQFNGVASGGAYGDDAQDDTNYPLVRITNTGTGHVFYARTHNHSRMGAEPVGDPTVVSTQLDVPSGMELGASTLVVVANGIPSFNYSVTVEPATALTITGASATTSDFNDPASVQANLTSGGSPVAGKTVTFVLGSGVGAPTCSATTNSSGNATCNITPNQPAGTYTLTATFASDSSYAGSSASAPFVVTKEEAALAYTLASATTANYDDSAQVQAQLITDVTPLAGKTVTFVLGSGGGAPTCSALTDGFGNATCSLTPNQPAGPQPLSATFTGDSFYVAAAASTTFTVTKEETTTKFTASSPTVIANGHTTTFSAVLKEDGVSAISGRSLTITLGTGGSAQSCVGTTDGTGTASCAIAVNQPLGPNTVAANFAGDAFYLTSSDSESAILFAFLARGSMIVGNLNAGKGNAVEYWGAQWAKINSLSTGPAPNAFKGFAATAPQSCGGNWTSSPGNSPDPPAIVPSYMGVIASSTALQSGNDLMGDVPIIIVVKTDSGYGPSPGHDGTGTVVAVFCH